MRGAAGKELVRRLVDEVINTGDVARLDEYFATDELAAGGKRWITERRERFPDFHCTIEDQLTEGAKVVTRLTMRGTNLGPLPGHAPTGKRMQTDAVFIWTIENDKITDMWSLIDHLRVREQLGLLPT